MTDEESYELAFLYEKEDKNKTKSVRLYKLMEMFIENYYPNQVLFNSFYFLLPLISKEEMFSMSLEERLTYIHLFGK